MRVGCGSKVQLGNQIGCQTGLNIGVESLGIHNNACVECQNIGRGSSERSNELFFRKDRMTVLWVYSTIGVISLFKVDVPSSSQCVGFSTEFTGSKPNNQIKLC